MEDGFNEIAGVCEECGDTMKVSDMTDIGRELTGVGLKPYTFTCTNCGEEQKIWH